MYCEDGEIDNFKFWCLPTCALDVADRRDGTSIEFISSFTGLSESEVKALEAKGLNVLRTNLSEAYGRNS